MSNTRIYAAFFPSKEFYNVEIPSQALCGKGTTPGKALYNIIRTHATDGRGISENARNKLSSRIRKNLIKERGLKKIIFDIEEIMTYHAESGQDFESATIDLANEMLEAGSLEGKRCALHFAKEICTKYATIQQYINHQKLFQ